ncbi:hypothetical protein [Carnobacterium maltaromaticum]|uniref:hypothetical protein n=1 Tax=Carnobacterium maltaromaticum TaxID=2751 RepID=UPI000553384E|nr:hypothetical protein [Carnobacterium maltaromaticum]KRN59873.1 hypothetical protein IV70_GL001368 [Carnobacterium maltaromaticum DSM 20342]
MQAISVFEITSQENFERVNLINKETSEKRELNGTEETFKTEMFVNETISQYTRLAFAMDEEFKLKGKVFNQDITGVVIKNTYDGYFNNIDGTLILFANRSSADFISQFVSEEFNLNYTKKIFDLETIMRESSDVRKTQFKNVRIQTLSGSSLNGNRVNQTELYDLLNQNGELSQIAVTYPINNVDVSFSISTNGAIVLFSTMENIDILTLIEELFLF